jgi:dTDP-glucose 4,6-dehydratase
LSEGKPGEKYNFGGDSERSNLDVVTQICDVVDRLCPGSTTRRSMITFVPDRPGHDVRYAIDASKAHRELGWQPTRTFEEGLTQTVSWYLNGRAWWERARSGVYDGSRLGLLATQH